MTAAATSAPARVRPRSARPIPGLGPTLGVTVAVVLAIVVVPVSALVLTAARAPLELVVRAITDPRTLAACGLSLGASALAALVASPLGLAIAWALARWEFPGRRAIDALVDLPFALPTAVSGIALTTLCAPAGWVGALLAPLGIELAFTRAGIVVALLFTGLPFVVRTVQPVIEDLPVELEEAAASLGASPASTVRRVLLPRVAPGLLAGGTLAFARALGEYGSVVFIAGNMPMQTEIAPLRILGHLESYDYASAAVVASAMVIASAGLLLAVNALQKRMARHAQA